MHAIRIHPVLSPSPSALPQTYNPIPPLEPALPLPERRRLQRPGYWIDLVSPKGLSLNLFCRYDSARPRSGIW